MADKRRYLNTFLFFAILLGFGAFSPLSGEEINNWFGVQGSINGDTYLVGQRYGQGLPGSPQDVGSVHVFDRASASSWPETPPTLESLLLPGSLVQGAQFGGGAVLLDGDTAVVGAYRNTVDGYAQAGNVFVFTRNGSIWSQGEDVTVLGMPGGAVGNALFGAAGDIDGDRLMLSAPGANSAYVFTRSGMDWDSGIELAGGDIESPLGVAIDGDLAAVGNYGQNPHVDLWRYNQNSSQWELEHTINNPGTANTNLFGASLDISGNTLVVSARQAKVGEYSGAGAVYVYEYDDVSGTWPDDPITITNPTPATNDIFGYDVAIDGDSMAVGAPRDDDSGEIDAGAAYLFTRSDSIWTPDDTYTAETPEAGKWFGEIVGLSEDVLLAGGPGRSTDSGDVYWFDIVDTPFDPGPGDANGDGIVDDLDATILAANWMSGPNASWEDGDFNNDGFVNDRDATIMAVHWLETQNPVASVPEPNALVFLLGLAAVGLLRRRAG